MATDLQPSETIESNDTENLQETVNTVIELPQIIKTTRIIAWIVLIAGVLGSLEIYNSIGSEYISGAGSVTNVYAIVLALGVLFFAIVLWAILSILAFNSENLFYMRHDLYNKNYQ